MGDLMCACRSRRRLINAGVCVRIQLMHSGERPFVCPYRGCGMRFSQRYNRDSHVKARHSGEEGGRPFLAPFPRGTGAGSSGDRKTTRKQAAVGPRLAGRRQLKPQRLVLVRGCADACV